MKARKSAQVASYSCRLLIGAMSLRIASAEGTWGLSAALLKSALPKVIVVAPPGRSKTILEEDAPPGGSKAILEEDAPPGGSKAILEEDWMAPSE